MRVGGRALESNPSTVLLIHLPRPTPASTAATADDTSYCHGFSRSNTTPMPDERDRSMSQDIDREVRV